MTPTQEFEFTLTPELIQIFDKVKEFSPAAYEIWKK